MVQGIEHFRAELKLEPLRYLERLNESQIEIPVMRRGENVSASSILTRSRYAECLS